MPKATFIAQPDPCAVFGRVFPFNVPVDVSDLDPAYIDALAGNPTFTMDYSVSETKAAAKAKAAATDPAL